MQSPFVPPAGGMKFLLDFFSKKSRESRGQSPLVGARRAKPSGARREGDLPAYRFFLERKADRARPRIRADHCARRMDADLDILHQRL